MSELERSVLFCAAPNRKGKPCGKLGHRLAPDGRRFCGSHWEANAPDAAKLPIRCEGRLADGSPCNTMAEQLVVTEEADDPLPLCHFHAKLAQATGSARQQPKPGRRGRPEDNGDLTEEEDELLGGLRVQLASAAPEFAPLIVTKLRAMLESSNVSANVAALRLLIERYAPVEGSGAGPPLLEESHPPDWDTVSTRQLEALVYPRPGIWEEVRDASFASRIDKLIRLDKRVASGGYVDSEDLREAQAEAANIRRWRRITEPVEGLTFATRASSAGRLS